MSSPFILAVILHCFHQVTWATVFPPVRNSPPIPGQAVRTLDISGQRYYVQDDLQSNPPQSMIKEEGLLPPDLKPDNQRWFIPENQSDETSDYPSSTEAFERYYANGLPAVGPVATPLPDETYMIQSSSSNKVPDAPSNVGNSDIWVLTRGPDNQYIPERWMQVPLPTERVVEVISQERSPKTVSESVKSIPFPSPLFPPQKSQFSPPPPANVAQEIWIRSPGKIQSQNTAAIIDELPSIKQMVDVPQTLKQIVQPQITKQLYQPPLSSPVPVLSKKPAALPIPPPPPSFKSSDITSPKQIITSSAAVDIIPDDPGYVLGKNAVVSQVKHIWIPTSPQTGKFITVPVSGIADQGKSGPMKGVSSDSASPIDVSQTWILKQDGPLPRFEPQRPPFLSPVVQSGKLLIDDTSKIIQTDSPKNLQQVGKSISDAVPVSMWPVSKNIPDQTFLGKSEASASPFPILSQKLNTVTAGTGNLPVPPAFPPKNYVNNEKFLSPPELSFRPLAGKFSNEKPCPLNPQISPFPLKGVTVPIIAKPMPNAKPQPIMRIIRINRYPYASYVSNPRIRPNAYAYSRPAAVFLRRMKNGFIRLIPTSPLSTSVPIRRPIIQVPATKSSTPIIYPPVQGVSRLRYNYPWGGYLNSFPIPGKNVFPMPQIIDPKVGSLVSTSSGSSSSSESSSSESSEEVKETKKIQPKETKKVENTDDKTVKKLEPIKVEEPMSSGSSSESEPEKESKSASKESEKETEEVQTESQSTESIEVAESQFTPHYEKSPNGDISDESKLKLLLQKYALDYERRDSVFTLQHSKEAPAVDSEVVGSYGYRDINDSFRNVGYEANEEYKSQVETNEPDTIIHKSTNTANTVIDTTTSLEKINVITELPSKENLTKIAQRD